MSGRLFIFGLALLVFQFTVVQGQSTTQEFLNIACGLPKDQGFNDSRGLPYISDSEFIDTGESAVVKPLDVNSTVNNLRRFPNGTRNCYKVPIGREPWKYLVRARFKYGNYDGRNNFPQFDLYLGINYWGTLSNDADLEIIVVTVSNFISICLVNTNQGTPFISGIELRPLTDSLYSEANTSQSLVLLNRRNLGGDLVRYPEDDYDRFWSSDKPVSLFPASKPSNNFILPINTSSFVVPYDVMRWMVYPADQTATSLSSNVSVTSVGACPSTHAYFVFYFAEIDPSVTELRTLRVSVDDLVIFDGIHPEKRKTIQFEKSVPINGNQLTFSVANASGSAELPFLNALEIYRIIDMTCQSETRSLDVETMMDVKSRYKVQRNWNGDPCAPKAYMWEGLNCSYNGSSSPLITFLNLSSSGLTGEILPSLGNLSAMQYLDLSSNSLTGEIPDSLSRLTQLKVLNLANNNLTGSIPKALLSMSANGRLNLNRSGNPNLCIIPDSCQLDSSKKSNKYFTIVASCVVVAVVVLIVVSVVFWKCTSELSFDVNKTQKFTPSQVRKITRNFKKVLGEGGYGKVYLGKNASGVKVAVKTLIPSKLSPAAIGGFQEEAKILAEISHKNLVKLIGYCANKLNLALVYEYMGGGSLEDHLSDKDKRTELSWRRRLQIAFEVAKGLEYLHTGLADPIIHRDIKPGNILLTEKLDARIADFGLSKIFENEGVSATSSHMMVTGVAGTRGYLDPEYAATQQLRDKSDVYSFGVVLMVLITGLSEIVTILDRKIHITDWVRERVSSSEIEEVIDKSIKEEYDENSVLDFVKIAEKCTRMDYQERPDITEVVEEIKKLCTAYDESHPPTSDNPQEQPQADVVGSNGEELDDVPLQQK